MLEVKNLYCGYGDTDIVKDMSFDLADGEILSVTGPNGCGKTTLLRAVSGLIPYHGGSIKIDGDEEAERDINYSIFHSVALHQESGNKNTFGTMSKRC